MTRGADRDREAGFTMIELIASIVLFSVVILVAMQSSLVAGRVTASLVSTSELDLQAHRVVDQIAEELMQARLETDTTASWLQKLAAQGVPAGPINDLREVLTNAHASERKLVRTFTNGAGDAVPTVANPVNFGATPVSYRRAPPLLGEHTEEVLRDWLGYSANLIDTLRQDAAI